MKDAKRINDFITEALAIDIQEAKKANALGFMSRALVNCTLPHSKVEGNEYVRKNGAFTLTLLAPSAIGIPYGTIPRLIMAWISTQAVKTKSREIVLGDSLHGFMRELGIAKGGTSTARLRDQLNRLTSCTISCSYNEDLGDHLHDSGIGFRPFSKIDIWWSKKPPKDDDQTSLFNSTLTLSEEFYQEIIGSPIVFEMDTLKRLKQSSMAVDLYTWITYRNSYAKKDSYIPWESLQLQFGAGYPMTAQGQRDFKKKFIEALAKVALAYPEASKLRPEKDHLVFVPGRPHVPKKLFTIDHV